MNKSIYCVKWAWFDENGERLPSRCVTHAWFTSSRKALKEFESQRKILYSNYSDRKIEGESPNMDWSPEDGTYELQVVRIHAHQNERSYIRLVLAATNLN